MHRETCDEFMDLLEKELSDAGVPIKNGLDGTPMNPTSVLVNCGISVKPFVNIILKYAPKLDIRKKTWIARCLSEKGNKQAVPFLLSIFNDYNREKIDLWAVGNALYIIDDKASYPAIIEICKNSKFGSSRQMLMGTLARAKSPEAYKVLIDCLEDITVRGHAIEGLGRFGSADAIPVLEKLNVEKGFYEYKARETALKKLKKKLEKSTS
ncbi:HEAT repeat domain-containing protein [Neobacillus sp. NPDC058068]|uniref:HEAT repeat domain-containing protein n=1 Tax=Neobacillus sp. NPDC058068 TaxID=3346325 RepID=UPI0036D8E9DC